MPTVKASTERLNIFDGNMTGSFIELPPPNASVDANPFSYHR